MAMVLSTGFYMALRNFFPLTFISSQWDVYHTKTHMYPNLLDYLSVHIEEIQLFNLHVSPCILNTILAFFEPSKISATEYDAGN